MDDGRPYGKDSRRDDGGLTEAVAPTHGDNAKDADCQVGKANLELEGITGWPADGLRDRVRNEEVTEESTDSASGDTDPEEIQQEDFQPALAGSTTPVQTDMAGSDDDRQDGEDEDADRNTVHTFSIPQDIARFGPSTHHQRRATRRRPARRSRDGLASSTSLWWATAAMSSA